MKPRLFALILLFCVPRIALADNAAGEYVDVVSDRANAAEIARECDAILERIAKDYGKPPGTWRRFTVYVSGGGGGGYCTYQGNRVGRVVVRTQYPGCVGGTLDHELQHAYLFYLLQKVPYIAINEGLSELVSEKKRDGQRLAMYNRAKSGRTVPLASILRLYDYPADSLSVYTQGYSVGEFLILHWDLPRYIEFIEAVNASGDYDRELQRFYHYENLRAFESAWLDWVKGGQHYNEVKRLNP